MRIGIGIIAMAILLAVSPMTFGLYGGEYIPYAISKCEYLMINITPSHLSEWNVTPYCHEDFNGSFYCACSDNYNINLTSKPNSFGNYTINITSFWSDQQSRYQSSVSFQEPSSSSYVFKNYTINATQVIYKETNITTYNESSITWTDGEDNTWNNWYIKVIIFLLLLSLTLIAILLKKRKSK
jgi:hypothetical protein